MYKFKVESKRVLAMLNLAGITEKNQKEIIKYMNQSGIDRVIERFNELYDTNIQLGEYIIQSKSIKGFWSNDFGWCKNKDGATGFTEQDLNFYKDSKGIAKPNFHEVADATFVLYDTAKDFK
jgi:hypothetical protein